MSNALIFPGQGSQYVGMGRDLSGEFATARAVFDEADAVLGVSLSALCFGGPEADLTDTLNAQPALLTHSIATLRVLESRGTLTPAWLAGHSLGEYSALVAAGALTLADALLLVRERGRVMKAAGEQHPGMMVAILGLDSAAVEAVCAETGVEIANYNAPGQIVISGARDDMERAIAAAKNRGARRTVALAVSIAAHSRWMESAARSFAGSVSATPIRPPRIPVISNVSAQPLDDANAIRTELVTQLTHSVQWIKTVEFMVAQGVTHVIEVGPKDVLAGLNRRICKEMHAISIGDLASVQAFSA